MHVQRDELSDLFAKQTRIISSSFDQVVAVLLVVLVIVHVDHFACCRIE
jgi:hypothetical protein